MTACHTAGLLSELLGDPLALLKRRGFPLGLGDVEGDGHVREARPPQITNEIELASAGLLGSLTGGALLPDGHCELLQKILTGRGGTHGRQGYRQWGATGSRINPVLKPICCVHRVVGACVQEVMSVSESSKDDSVVYGKDFLLRPLVEIYNGRPECEEAGRKSVNPGWAMGYFYGESELPYTQAFEVKEWSWNLIQPKWDPHEGIGSEYISVTRGALTVILGARQEENGQGYREVERITVSAGHSIVIRQGRPRKYEGTEDVCGISVRRPKSIEDKVKEFQKTKLKELKESLEKELKCARERVDKLDALLKSL